MFSSSGISWRHGPHQLAQKLSITTWPLYWARLILGPPRESRLNCGAGPLALEPAEAGTAVSSAAMTAPVSIAAIRFFITSPYAYATLASHNALQRKEKGRSERRFHVVGQLGYTEQIRAEHTILDLEVNRHPVRRKYLVA